MFEFRVLTTYCNHSGLWACLLYQKNNRALPWIQGICDSSAAVKQKLCPFRMKQKIIPRHKNKWIVVSLTYIISRRASILGRSVGRYVYIVIIVPLQLAPESTITIYFPVSTCTYLQATTCSFYLFHLIFSFMTFKSDHKQKSAVTYTTGAHNVGCLL